MCTHAKTRRLLLAATTLLSTSAVLAGPASATQYDFVVLDNHSGQAYGVYNGTAVGYDAAGMPTIWSNSGATATHLPLAPAYVPAAGARFAIWGNQVGGFAFGTADNRNHAVLWNGTSSLPVDLGAFSQVNGIYNGIQVGTNSADDAVLWQGTAASVTSLSPTGATFFTEPTGVWGNEASGRWHRDPTGSDPHAAVWTSLSSSGFVDLSQPSFIRSDALGVARGQVAGWALIVNVGKHAATWTNSAASFQDLGPAGTTASELFATNGIQQAGDVSVLSGGGSLPPDHHAAVWRGTAAGYQLLPGPPGSDPLGFQSFAYGIDGKGDIVGVFNTIPVMWVPHRLAGDANFDGTVNFSDLLLLSQHYGQPGEWVDGEFSGGGTVNFGDLLTLAQNYGRSQSAAEQYTMEISQSQSIPEPLMGALLSLLYISMIKPRRTFAMSRT